MIHLPPNTEVIELVMKITIYKQTNCPDYNRDHMISSLDAVLTKGVITAGELADVVAEETGNFIMNLPDDGNKLVMSAEYLQSVNDKTDDLLKDLDIEVRDI